MLIEMTGGGICATGEGIGWRQGGFAVPAAANFGHAPAGAEGAVTGAEGIALLHRISGQSCLGCPNAHRCKATAAFAKAKKARVVH